MGPKKENIQKDDAVFQEILGAAKILFSELGLKKTTMEDIAQHIGKGKSTLYYYFSSKDQIFEAVVKEELKNLTQELRLAINKAPTAPEKFKILGKVQLASVIKYQNLDCVLQDEILDKRKRIEELRNRFEKTLIDMIQEIIHGGIQEGAFRDLSTETIHKLSFTMIAIFRGLHLPTKGGRRLNIPSDQYFDSLIDLLIEGIGLRK